MKKYYIGLVVLLALALGLLGYTLYQANLAKKDRAVSTKVQTIADDLNSYVSANNKIPSSLQEAGIKDVPAAVKYTKVSSERYTFCVTYKASSRGFSVSASEMAAAALFSRFYGGSGYNSDGTSDYEASQLFIYDFSGHKQGETCYKVKPYLADATYPTGGDYYCDPSYEYYEYFKSNCPDGASTFNLLQN